MNGYVPYRTTITSGDITREPVNVAAVIGEQVNKIIGSLRTLYTMQNYANQSTVTVQTNSLAGLNNQRNKITPPVLDFSSKPRGIS